MSACRAGQQHAGLKADWVKWPKANIDYLIYCESITHTTVRDWQTVLGHVNRTAMHVNTLLEYTVCAVY